jgi:hyperosmotically inducible periplasmic protein
MSKFTKYLPLTLGAIAVAMLTTACSKTEPTAAVVEPPATTIGTDLDDSVVTARVKSALAMDSDVKGMDISVETRKGEVILSGFVDSGFQVERALALTQTIEGVGNVRNDLVVKQ